MDGKNLRLAAGLAAVALAIFLALLWQPARQVRLHQRHLLKAVEKRNWQAVWKFIGAEYRDRWGHDKENVLSQSAQVFGQFVFCNIEAQEHSLILVDGAGTIGVRLALGGTGGPIAEYAKQRVETARQRTHRSVHFQMGAPKLEAVGLGTHRRRSAAARHRGNAGTVSYFAAPRRKSIDHFLV